MGRVIDYNRFLYARGNPLKYSDPSGYASCSTDECWNNRWYLAHGYKKPQGGSHWSERITAVFQDEGILKDVLGEAGIRIDGGWDLLDPTEFENASMLAQGVVAFAQKIADHRQVGIEPGLAHLKTLIGGSATWYRAATGPDLTFCYFGDACAVEPYRVGFYDNHFKRGKFTTEDKLHNFIRGTAVHELAHKIHAEQMDPGHHRITSLSRWFPNPEIKISDWLSPNLVTGYGLSARENWAEGVTVWTYPKYRPRPDWDTEPINLSDDQKEDIRWILGP